VPLGPAARYEQTEAVWRVLLGMVALGPMYKILLVRRIAINLAARHAGS
jgi:hypothetical protein